MPFGRMRAPLVLSQKDREKLRRLKASRTEAYSRVVRAEILLAYEAGDSVSGIARRLGVSRPTSGFA